MSAQGPLLFGFGTKGFGDKGLGPGLDNCFYLQKNTFLFKEVTGFTYKKSMLSTCIWSEAEILELPSRRKIEFKNILS